MTKHFKNIPSISNTAFSCPHCGAYTTQSWHYLFAQPFSKEQRTPHFPEESLKDEISKNQSLDQETRDHLFKWIDSMNSGKPFFDYRENSISLRAEVHNCYISSCFNCNEITVWIHDRFVYPSTRIEIEPNDDLPLHIKQIFEEARSIVNNSPKGSAALLRLCIQYLCKELGQSGKNIDSDIANLVSKGLNPIVQQALDVVRVIGNESVHPGEIDLNDNKDDAIKLFELVNLIAEQMISHPKKVESLYQKLPESKKSAIKIRDGITKK